MSNPLRCPTCARRIKEWIHLSNTVTKKDCVDGLTVLSVEPNPPIICMDPFHDSGDHAVSAHSGLVEALRHALTRDHAHTSWCDGCTRAQAALAAAERRETT